MDQTPLIQALEAYQEKGYARFHMPGHKGAAIPVFEALTSFDVTEIEGTDSLFEEGPADSLHPLKQLEELYTKIYISDRTVLSAGGSTLCIQAMLRLAAERGKRIAAGRNLHTSAVNAMALLGLEPVWIYPERDGERLIGRITPKQVEEVLRDTPHLAAVYLTSPDYFGVMSDIKGIAAVCHRYGLPLLVDNAHGAHLKFMPQPLHPMDLGADLCCDSLHKTLPALTGAALLHSRLPEFSARLKEAMSVFASTSPSYLILLSCDLTAGFLEADGIELLQETAERCERIKTLSEQRGWIQPKHCDPMRITLPLSGTGYGAEQFRPVLRRYGIMEEFLSDSGCVLLASPFNREKDFQKIEALLEGTGVQQGQAEPYPMFRPEKAASLREALLAPRETVEIEQAGGRIAAQVKSPCPPGIPLIMPGEILHKDHINILKLYGIFSIDVLK